MERVVKDDFLIGDNRFLFPNYASVFTADVQWEENVTLCKLSPL